MNVGQSSNPGWREVERDRDGCLENAHGIMWKNHMWQGLPERRASQCRVDKSVTCGTQVTMELGPVEFVEERQ